jgi:hypothetical protein
MSDSSPATYVGRLQGTDAVIAVVRSGGTVMAYACGGPSTYATQTNWFPAAAATAGAFQLQHAGWSLAGGAAGDGFAGSLVAPDGASFAWNASPVGADTAAGLYAVSDEGCRTGVVIIQSSPDSPPAVQGTWCNAQGAKAPVTPVILPAPGANRVTVRATAPDGPRVLAATRVESPGQQ